MRLDKHQDALNSVRIPDSALGHANRGCCLSMAQVASMLLLLLFKPFILNVLTSFFPPSENESIEVQMAVRQSLQPILLGVVISLLDHIRQSLSRPRLNTMGETGRNEEPQQLYIHMST